jgi:hypothetical protein
MEDTMSIEKVMEILDEFEVKAAKDIELDRAIDADNYESVGKYKLIQNIRKQISKTSSVNHQEVQ